MTHEYISKSLYGKECQVTDKPLRVAISGKMASGKSTLAKRLAELYNLEIITFAKRLKEYCSAISAYSNDDKQIVPVLEIIDVIAKANSFSEEDLKNFTLKTKEYAELFRGVHYVFNETEEKKPEKARQMLQYIGEDIKYCFGPDIWINTTLQGLRFDGRYICDDLRFTLEYDRLKENNFVLIRLTISKEEQRKRLEKSHGVCDESILNHPTETYLDNHVFDFQISADVQKKNVLEKAVSIMNILDYNAAKLDTILRNGNTNDFKHNVIMGFDDPGLAERNPADYDSRRYRSDNCKEYFA